MPHRALIEKRPWLLASLAAGIGFWLLKDSGLPGLYQIALKGGGVALLAIYAFNRHKGHDANTIAAVMGFGALSDELIEFRLELGGMAATAWLSGFSRYRVGLGAVMFVASDLLIFARMGVLAQSPLPGLLIWPLYYFGQLLICVGVVGELRRREHLPLGQA